MRYFFVLGNNVALSLAELKAVLALRSPRLLAKDFLVAETDQIIDATRLIAKLGGTIKIGEIEKEGVLFDKEKIRESVLELIEVARQEASPGKFNFGLSDYGSQSFDKKDLGLKIKKYFNEHQVSSRFVISQEKTLSSVVVTQNKLLTRGIEIILAADGRQALIGRTLSVQPFKELSARDYGRPARDSLSGMLPPKLALVMINLAQIQSADSVILDPFCGSGTVLSEAALCGYKNLFASDISPQAVSDTRANVNWVKERYRLENLKLKLFVKKAEHLSQFIKTNYVEAIITEPYLGPQRGRLEFAKVIFELEKMYSAALHEFWQVLRPEGRVVMVWPLFYGERAIRPNYQGFKIIKMIPSLLGGQEFLGEAAQRTTLVYGRPGQKVYREIVVLQKE